MTSMLDVIVIGAGPAGSVTAALLKRFGYRVEIWERQTFPRHRIGESLPPRAVDLLSHLKLKAEGFAVMEGHTSIWGRPETHRAVFQEGYGLQVQRAAFDQQLLDQAGVPVHFDRTAIDLIKEDGKVAGVRHAGGEVRAQMVVMANGSGKGTRHLRQSAIYGYWQNSKHPGGSQANDTIIESFPDGWVWSLRLADDSRNVTVLTDNPGTAYEDAIRQTHFVRGILEGAELLAKPSGCDASWRSVDAFAEPGVLYVGDAGCVIDPLSSQGVYKALCSAMSAAVVINTCLKKPAMEQTALQFFNDEERRAYSGYSSGGVAMFRGEQRWPDRPFWKVRHELSAWDPSARSFSEAVASAIETGSGLDMQIRNASGTRIAQCPAMVGPLIEVAEYVVTPTFDYGYRGSHATTILAIHRSLSTAKSVRTIVAENNRFEISLLLRVISYMYREGLIETAGA